MKDLHYPVKEWLRVDIDQSQVDETNTVEAGEHCKLFSQYATVGINKSNFGGEIEAISLSPWLYNSSYTDFKHFKK